jgi:hypothetical protein
MTVPPPPGKDDPEWQDADREDVFWQTHYDEFLAKYPDQFVAVRDGRVVATAYDLRDVLASLRAQGLEPTETWIQHFATASSVAL